MAQFTVVVDDDNNTSSIHNKVMLAVEIPFVLIAICTVVLRVYSRLAIKRKLAVDDVLIILGTCFAFGRTIISCMSADDSWGFDRDGPDQTAEVPYYQHIFERRIAYIFAVAFTRWSVLAYYLRIFPPGLWTLRRLCWVLLFLAFAQFIEIFVVLIYFCKDIGMLWTSNWLSFTGSRCFSSSTYSYSAAIGDSVIDTLIFALPIPYVWRLSKLRARQRIGLIVIFSLGLIVCVVALLQIPFIRRREAHASYFGGTINLLVSIQISLAIVAASLPDLRALVARSFPKFSPLHHRSLATAGEAPRRRDAEMGEVQEVEEPRPAFDQRRRSKKPDWMRSAMPASLMSTRVTHNELTRADTAGSVPGLTWACITTNIEHRQLERGTHRDPQSQLTCYTQKRQKRDCRDRQGLDTQVSSSSIICNRQSKENSGLVAPRLLGGSVSRRKTKRVLRKYKKENELHGPHPTVQCALPRVSLNSNPASVGVQDMAPMYDFIIVGGGTAGCLLAHRLSHAARRPSVLLVEAGSHPEGEYLSAPFHRYSTMAMRPDLDHGFISTPQKELNNRTITYTRGKGLGGTSILNFAVYLYGSKEDYNRWAELVGDESWDWEHTKKSFQEIEDFDIAGASQYPHLANPNPQDHGKGGTVKVCLPPKLEKGIAPSIEAVLRNGEMMNLDVNSGNPIGFSIFPATYSKDGRTTSANAHLVDAPDNLEIWTNAAVHRLMFDGTKVIGIMAADGREATSHKEVIICGGAIDTPKLLLLNGIGPSKELEALGIDVVKNLPGVGKQLHDHVMTFLSVEVDTDQNDRYALESNKEMVAEAQALWEKDKSGDFALHHSALWGAFLKLADLEEYPEYKALDKAQQEFLSRDAVPTYEIVGSCVRWPPGTVLPEGSGYFTAIAFLMNPVSVGSITLQSANPADKPVIDLGYLQHPYDRRVLREAIRQTWTKVLDNPDMKQHVKRRLYGPESLSDGDIDAFMKEAATTVWHGNGSVKMGKNDDPLACVDPDLKVYGVEGLRIADLSVCPLTTKQVNHTQATAYLVGQKAADTLIAEYRL
ncbi:hypothetical protein BDV95DRAFT_505141 [Massariosphaeria phaeospora]|uniref:Glucose-methanol-choline oxidoreductase N-terminal domain-containing protein n=1 Tax=Massariosphaeria phaeospora TaxID=100035 RepID=A0A7C8I3Y8_9PLEO|nr:hypothetical protein BDV95DRAFT_505141 [Massariosphaeria phaeospora]